MSGGEPLLRVRDLTLRFGGVTALDDVGFEVFPREFFAIIGPNGAGKTSLFNCLSGIVRPTGSITVADREIAGLPPHVVAARGVARTFQNLGLFGTLTTIENILVGRHAVGSGGILAGALWWGPAKRTERAARERAYEIADLLDLLPHADAQVEVLPYGIRKRIELAKAVALDPVLLLLDEPVAGMNHDESAELMGYVERLRGQLGFTTLLIEHDIRLVMELADRVLALDFGQPIGLGTPAEIQADPRVIEAYLGTPAVPEPEQELEPEQEVTQ